METKNKTSVTTTHSNSDGRELLKYYNFSKKMNSLEFKLRDLDNYEFPLNRKAVKEIDKYYKSNLIDLNNDKKYTKDFIDSFKKLAFKLEGKYKSDIDSESNSYNRIHISRNLSCSLLNIKGSDLDRLISMFKDETTLTIDYDKLPIRLLAYYSEDKKLNDLIKYCDDTSEDFYAHLAAIIFNNDYNDNYDVKWIKSYNCADDNLRKVINVEGKNRRTLAKQVIAYEIYRKIPDIKYKKSFLKYVDIFEDYFGDLKIWVNKMLQYDKPYIQDIFGNVFVFNNSYLQNRSNCSISALIGLTETSIHKLFLLKLMSDNIVNIRLPLQNNFIVDCITVEDLFTCKYKIFDAFYSLFKKLNLKLIINT